MICRNCNQIIDDNVKFCPNCGTPQDPAPQEEILQNEVQKETAPLDAGSQGNTAQDPLVEAPEQLGEPQQHVQVEEQKAPAEKETSSYYYEQPGEQNQSSGYGQPGEQNQSGNYTQSGNYNQSGNYSQPGHYDQYGNTYQNPAEMINTTPYLVFAILTTICCCIPLGIPAIIFASKINAAQLQGHYDEARDCAKKAKLFSILAAVLGILFSVIWFVIILISNYSYYYY